LGFPIHGAKYNNVFNTNSYGIDIEGKTFFGKSLVLDYGLTWQELRNMSNYNYDGTESTKYYNTRLPNIPWLYGNLGLIYSRDNLLMKNSKTVFRFRIVYVQEYFLRPEADGGGSSKYTIPTQFYQNIGLQHYFTSLNLSVGMEVQNIFDQDLYDNFRVQRPGRTIQFLIRYQIN
jgi:hypothetical protein